MGNKLTKKTSSSSYYLVQHSFATSGEVDTYWDQEHLVINQAAAKSWLQDGFKSHLSVASGRDGPVFCIWEVREGISAEQFKLFIDGVFGKWFVNHVTELSTVEGSESFKRMPFKDVFA